MKSASYLLDPAVAVLLIGERPGLATAESLSAYMAYRPRQHHSDAKPKSRLQHSFSWSKLCGGRKGNSEFS